MAILISCGYKWFFWQRALAFVKSNPFTDIKHGVCRHSPGSSKAWDHGLTSEIGSGLAAHHRSERPLFRREDWTNLKCSHCDGSRHTKDTCFKLIGYPDWEEDLQKKKAAPRHRQARSAAKLSWLLQVPPATRTTMEVRMGVDMVLNQK